MKTDIACRGPAAIPVACTLPVTRKTDEIRPPEPLRTRISRLWWSRRHAPYCRVLLAACVSAALVATTVSSDAGTWSQAPLSDQAIRQLPENDTLGHPRDELFGAMMGLYYGGFDETREAKRRHRRKDDLTQVSAYVGWVPYRALAYEHAAIKQGLGRVATRLRGYPAKNLMNYACFGLERGGGFIADVISHVQFPATPLKDGPTDSEIKFGCKPVNKESDSNRPSGTVRVSVPNGDGTETLLTQENSKRSDQARLLQAINGAATTKDIVIVDSFVSGDSMMYTLETVAKKLAANRNSNQRFVVLAIRDGARSRGGYPLEKVDTYMKGDDAGLPYDELEQEDLKTWAHDSTAHIAGHRLAQNLVRTYGDRFTLIIATAWYLVAEDVAYQLTLAQAGTYQKKQLNPLYVYGFLKPDGEDAGQMLDPYLPGVQPPTNVHFEAPGEPPGFYVWSWTPARNETYRGFLAELVARATGQGFRDATTRSQAGIFPGHP